MPSSSGQSLETAGSSGMETAGSSGTLVRTYQIAWRHIAADRDLKKHIPGLDNLRISYL